jgi:hypothetical protein
MNSPTDAKNNENEPSSPQDMSPREMIEAAMASSIMEVMQLRRTLWLILNQVGKPMVLDERECSPLWRMKATRLDDGRVQLEAALLDEPTNEQLNFLAETLNGSRMEIDQAMAVTELKNHPPQYIEMALHSRVRKAESGYWVNAKLLDIGDSKPTGNN